MQVMEAYFDESGIHDGSLVCVVAGVIADALVWKEFTADWQRLLEGAQIRAFHATDCANGAGEFKSWDPARRTSFYNDAVQLILVRRIRGFAVLVPTEGYTKAFSGSPGKSVFPQPYLIGFRQVIDKACELTESEGQDSIVSLTFELATRQQGRARELADFLMTYATSWEHFDRASKIAWATKSIAPLQVADVFAYEVYRYVTKPSQFSPRTPFVRKWPLIVSVESWSKDDLEMLARMAEIVEIGPPHEEDVEDY